MIEFGMLIGSLRLRIRNCKAKDVIFKDYFNPCAGLEINNNQDTLFFLVKLSSNSRKCCYIHHKFVKASLYAIWPILSNNDKAHSVGSENCLVN